MKKIWYDLFALVFFACVVGIFFAPTILKGQLPVPADALVGLYHPWRDALAKDYPRGLPFKNFLITDPVRQQIPWRKAAIDQWKDRILPSWNPYSFSGTSLVGNIQAAVFYPLNILFFLFEFPVAWTLLIMLEPLLAGILFYLFLRNRQRSPAASLFGAISWSFSGFSIAWLTWGTIGHVALWLPLLLLSIDKILQSKTSIVLHSAVVWGVVLVTALVMQFFAGHAQVSLYVFLLSLAYALWHLRLTKGNQRVAACWLTGGLSLFVVITSIQWIPLLVATIGSSRVLEAESWTKPGWFLPWQHLVQYIAPDFFGNPATLNYWGEWNYGEFVGYIGIIGLVFALVSLLHWKEKELRFWFIMLAGSLLFLLPTPIASLPYILHLPILSSLQPTRLTMVVDFALAILTAYGFDAFLKHKGKRAWVAMAGIGFLIALLWILVMVQGAATVDETIKGNWMVTQRNLVVPTMVFVLAVAAIIGHIKVKNATGRIVIILFLIGLTTVDLLRFGWKFTPFTLKEYFFPQTAVTTFLQQQQKPFRIVSVDNRMLPPNVSAVYGIETIEGYDPIVDARYEEFFAALARGKPDISRPFGFNRILTAERIDSPLLPLLNVQYILSLTDRKEAYLTKAMQEGETRVYEDTRALPRAYLVEEVKEIAGKQRIIETLFDPTFNPRTTAIVEKPLDVLSSPLSSYESVMIASYNPSSITLSVVTKNPRLLVIANAWNQNWNVTIDDKPANLLRTNYILQGAVVPVGTHRVLLSFGL